MPWIHARAASPRLASHFAAATTLSLIVFQIRDALSLSQFHASCALCQAFSASSSAFLPISISFFSIGSQIFFAHAVN